MAGTKVALFRVDDETEQVIGDISRQRHSELYW